MERFRRFIFIVVAFACVFVIRVVVRWIRQAIHEAKSRSGFKPTTIVVHIYKAPDKRISYVSLIAGGFGAILWVYGIAWGLEEAFEAFMMGFGLSTIAFIFATLSPW